MNINDDENTERINNICEIINSSNVNNTNTTTTTKQLTTTTHVIT